MDERGIQMNDIIISLVGTGLNDEEIYEYMGKSKEWGKITKEEIQKAIKNAKIELCGMASFNKEYETGKAIYRLNELYKKSMAIQDYKSCLAIQKEIDIFIIKTNNEVF
jgi:hypothetical protein